MPFLAALAVFGSIALFGSWYLRSRNVMEDRIRSLSAQRRAQLDEEDPFVDRVVYPVVHSTLVRITNMMPTALIGRARYWLMVSESTMSLPTFMAILLVLATLPAALLFALLAAQANGMPGGLALLFVMATVAMGVVLPLTILRAQAKGRQDAFANQLPDALDLLTTCVEAGLSLDFAFQRVADRMRGPVGQEIGRMLREKALGQTRREALTSLAERVDLPDVNVFVSSVIQSEELGTSIAQVLRIQARQLRLRRRQRAEQQAATASTKMVFPLVFFILPSLFIVIIGPIGINALLEFT